LIILGAWLASAIGDTGAVVRISTVGAAPERAPIDTGAGDSLVVSVDGAAAGAAIIVGATDLLEILISDMSHLHIRLL
jgi:hypothetical protein